MSAADYDNDGFVDLYLTYLGPDVLYRNNGDGTFTDVTAQAGVRGPGLERLRRLRRLRPRRPPRPLRRGATWTWARTTCPRGGPAAAAHYLGVPVLCGPRGLPGAPDALLPQQRRRHVRRASEASGAFDKEPYFGLGVVASDLDGDGDADLYVGNDATPNYLFVNRGDGRFDERGFASGTAVSGDGNEQASMGVDAADYDNDGRPDLYAAHFASDYTTLYRNLGGLLFEDVTARARDPRPGWS